MEGEARVLRSTRVPSRVKVVSVALALHWTFMVSGGGYECRRVWPRGPASETELTSSRKGNGGGTEFLIIKVLQISER